MSFSLPEPLRAALQSLGANRMRSALTTLGIVIGVASVVMVIQLTRGLEGRIMKEISKQGAHSFQLSSRVPWKLMEEGKVRRMPVEPVQVAELRALVPQITVVSPRIYGWQGPELKHRGAAARPQFQAIDEQGLGLSNLELAAGRNITPTERVFRSPVVIVGHGLAQKLGVGEDAIGRLLTFGGQSAELIGILKPQDIPFAGEDGQEYGPDATVFFPFGAFRELVASSDYEDPSYHILVSRDIPLEEAEEAMNTSFRAIRGLKGKEPDNFTMESSQEEEKEVRKVMNVLMLASGGLLSLALVVGGIGVMNIMLVTVKERTREIGVRKALGARRRVILVQFLVEAVLLCVLGGLVGLLLGQGLGQLLSKTLLHHVETPSLLALAVAFLVPSGVGLFFGLFPASQASRLDPIEALRYE